MADESPLISAEDAARAFRVTSRTILRWVETGKLTPAGRFSNLRGAVIFERAYIERMVAERNQAASEQAAS